MQSETMPSELNLSAPPTIPQARTYVSKQQSEYTEYELNKGTKIRFDIPRLQRSYLMKDSFVRFRLNMDLNPASVDDYIVAFDRAGVFGLIERIEVYDYLGGTLLEQTNNIPSLATLLMDLDGDIFDSCGKKQANMGIQTAVAIDDNTISDPQTFYVRAPVTGTAIADLNVNTPPLGTNGYFVSIELVLPVMSFLGMWSDKYVPLHNGFSVYFYLNSIQNALIARYRDASQNPPTEPVVENVWITNAEYVCQIMELGEQAESIVMASEPLIIHSKQYRHFSDIIKGGGFQSNFRFDLNLNVVSLRNIMFAMSPVFYKNTLLYPSYGHRIRNFLENWNFQYGSSYLPEIAGIACRSPTIPSSKSGYEFLTYGSDYYKAIGYTQALEELSKCSLNSDITNVDKQSYMIDTAFAQGDPYKASITTAPCPFIYGVGVSTNPDFIGKFAAGLNTRLSKKNTVSGIDTNGLQLSINGNFNIENRDNMIDAIIDVWAEHDSFVQIIPGVASTVTF